MEESPQSIAIGMGLAIGAGLGVSFGAVAGSLTGDLGLWIALGVPLGGGIGLATALVWLSLAQPRYGPGECPHCGYETGGLRTTTCPECGENITKPPPRIPPPPV